MDGGIAFPDVGKFPYEATRELQNMRELLIDQERRIRALEQFIEMNLNKFENPVTDKWWMMNHPSNVCSD